MDEAKRFQILASSPPLQFGADRFLLFKPFSITEADALAEQIKDWALAKGATHFAHWFQPWTGAGAEKHDSFLAWGAAGTLIDQLRGIDLLRGEPDASSLPSGGLRATHRARGYTMWDPASPPFLWQRGEEKLLCIPSLYFSWEGDALDYKIPLLRSESKLISQLERLFALLGIEEKGKPHVTLGIEQEYFLVDRSLFLSRPDLQSTGRTLFGAKPSKTQELEEHYFRVVPGKVLAFMADFEKRALAIGIPLKTRHSEVAPSQYEVAPLFERASLAVDHNLLLMELMRQTAEEHGLAVLFGEKPFAYINGSGKHCNWSIAQGDGENLLSPRGDSLLFLTLLTAVIRAVWEHGGLLRASVASLGNDHRLGANEAPPPIPSLFLGAALEKVVESVLSFSGKKEKKEEIRMIHLGLSHVPPKEADAGDRNRTAFLAFTGNKFELRAVGASAHPGFPVALLNAAVADALALLIDELAGALENKGEKFSLALPVLQKHLRLASGVVFGGDSYSPSWRTEAASRGLVHVEKSFDAFALLSEKRGCRALEEVFSERERQACQEVLIERYVKQLEIEARTMIEQVRTMILPAALADQKARGEALQAIAPVQPKHQEAELHALIATIEEVLELVADLEKILLSTHSLKVHARGRALVDLALEKMSALRRSVDFLETRVEEALWPLPKYRELLYHL